MALIVAFVLLSQVACTVDGSIADDMMSGSYVHSDYEYTIKRDLLLQKKGLLPSRDEADLEVSFDDIESLMKIDKVLSLNAKLRDDCKVKLEKQGSTLNISIQEEDCPSPPDMNYLLLKFVDQSKLFEVVTNNIIVTALLVVDNIIYEHTSKEIRFECKSEETYEIIPVYMSLTEMKAIIQFDCSKILNLVDMNITLRGNLEIKTQDSMTILDKPRNSETFNIVIETTSISPNEFAGQFQFRISEMTNYNIGFKTDNFESLELSNNPKAIGSWDKSRGFQFILSDIVSNTAAFSIARVLFILTKWKEMVEPSGAFVVKIEESNKGNIVNPYELLRNFLTYPIEDARMFQSISQPYVLMVSSDDVPLLFEENFNSLDLDILKSYHIREIPNGAHIRFSFDVEAGLKQCPEDFDANDFSQETVSVGYEVNPSGLSYYFPEYLEADLRKILKCINPEIQDSLPLELFNRNKIFEIKEVVFNRFSSTYICSVIFPGQLDVIEGILAFSRLEFRVESSKDGWTFTAATIANVSGFEIALTIEKSPSGFAINAMFTTISPQKMLQMLKIEPLLIARFPPQIKMLMDLDIKDLRMEIKLEDDSEFRMSGSPIIKGIDHTSLETLVWTSDVTKRPSQPRRGFCLGVVIRNIQLHRLFKQVLGLRFPIPGWLADLTVVVMYSNADRNPDGLSSVKENNKSIMALMKAKEIMDGIAIGSYNTKNNEEKTEAEVEVEDEDKQGMQILELAALEIKKGITIQALYQAPKIHTQCEDYAMCKFLLKKLGNSYKILLQARIDELNMDLKGVLVVNLKLAENLALTQIELVFEFQPGVTSMYISAELRMNNPTLTFTGKLQVEISGTMSLNFDMVGRWETAFGYERFALLGAQLGAGYTLGAIAPKFQLGGNLLLGSNENTIEIKIFFGFDPIGKDNYIFGTMTNVTVASIGKAYNLNLTLPRAIMESGFPYGIVISWTANPQGIELEQQGIRISPGLLIEGTINFLGYEAAITINAQKVQGSWSLLIIGKFDPLDIKNGLILLRRNKNEITLGPYLYFKMDKETFDLKIEGYAYVVGIEAATKIIITDTMLSINITGNLFGVLKTNVSIEASYGILASASFSFRACLSYNAEKIAEIIHGMLRDAGDAATLAFENAQASLERAQEKIMEAQEALNVQRRKINKYQEVLESRFADLEEQKRLVLENCKDQCGKICMGFLDWNKKCWKMFGWWVGCPKWNSCKWKVDDIICLAGCEMKKIGKRIVIWGEKLAIKILLGLSEAGKSILAGVEDLINLGKLVLDAANEVVEFAKQVTKVGMQITSYINAGALASIRIHYLCIGAKLDNTRKGCAGIELNATIFGLDIYFNETICITLSIHDKIADKSTNKRYPTLKKDMEGIKSVKAKIEEIKQEEIAYETEKTALDSDIEREIPEAKTMKRSTVPTEENMKILKAIESNVPNYHIKNPDIMSTYYNDAPWNIINDLDQNEWTGDRRTLEKVVEKSQEDKEQRNSCGQLRSVINRYDDLSNGVRLTIDGFQRQKVMLMKEKQKMLAAVDYLNAIAEEIDRNHNLTNNERRDLHFWPNEIRQGTDEWISNTKEIIKRIKKDIVPNLRNQINSIVKTLNHGNVTLYLASLHVKGRNALRRSDIPHHNQDHGAKHLEKASEIY